MPSLNSAMSGNHELSNEPINDGKGYIDSQNVRRLPAGPSFDVFFGDVNAMPDRQSTHVVRHEYTDHVAEEVDSGSRGAGLLRPGGTGMPFPARLHEMLDKIEKDGHDDVVSWQPHGRCFLVHKQTEFADKIMPKYFKMSKFPSFLRQLNLYGFRRLTRTGDDKGAYYHELFLRNKEFLANRIPRVRIKGNGVRARSHPEKEPDFYKMSPVFPGIKTASRNMSTNEPPLPTIPSSPPNQCLSLAISSTGESESQGLDFAGRQFHSVGEEISEQPILSKHQMNSLLQRLNISAATLGDIDGSLDNDFDYGNMMARLVGV
jgi:hypothetical protein